MIRCTTTDKQSDLNDRCKTIRFKWSDVQQSDLNDNVQQSDLNDQMYNNQI